MKKFQKKLNFNHFLDEKGWKLYDYQKAFLKNLETDKFRSFLIFSDTGTGKTITTFLPIILDKLNGLDKKIIYVAPLKSLITDIHKNLIELLARFNLKITVEKRTGDESYSFKNKQLFNQPDILLTTPESLALLMTKKESVTFFKSISYFIVDELSEIINTKRGDHISLLLTKIISLNDNLKIIASSPNVNNQNYLSKWLSISGATKIINNKYKKKFNIRILYSSNIPDYGHSCNFMSYKIYKLLKKKRTIIFVNTRAQAEILFMKLFSDHKDLKIVIHHGSLSKEVRVEAEQKMRNNLVDAIICTSSLEMGIDWVDIDQIIHIGTPKSINKLIQRVGRSNHKYFSTSKAFLVPTNKFEYFETQACINLLKKGTYDIIKEKKGAKDVLCQYLLTLSCNFGFKCKSIYKEILKAYPYKDLEYKKFLRIVNFIYDGGYVLNNYNRWKKLTKTKEGEYFISNNQTRTNILMNIGTIIDSELIKVMNGKKLLGNVDQNFINFLNPGDVFNFSGITVKCISIESEQIQVRSLKKKTNKFPVYLGSNQSFGANLSDEILDILSDNYDFPDELKKFLTKQKEDSDIPKKNLILIELFPYEKGEYLFFHTFLGRQTNQTLSKLISDHLSYNKILPSSYVLNDYSFGLYLDSKCERFKKIIDSFFNFKFSEIQFMNTHLAKTVFKEVSYISGLLPKNHINKKKKNFISSDNIFDTLLKYEPEHILMKITEEEVKNHFIRTNQLNKFFSSNYLFKKLNKHSQFSISLINEKSKFKINGPI